MHAHARVCLCVCASTHVLVLGVDVGARLDQLLRYLRLPVAAREHQRRAALERGGAVCVSQATRGRCRIGVCVYIHIDR